MMDDEATRRSRVTQEEDDLRRALRLSEEDEEKAKKEREEANQRALMDDSFNLYVCCLPAGAISSVGAYAMVEGDISGNVWKRIEAGDRGHRESKGGCSGKKGAGHVLEEEQFKDEVFRTDGTINLARRDRRLECSRCRQSNNQYQQQQQPDMYGQGMWGQQPLQPQFTSYNVRPCLPSARCSDAPGGFGRLRERDISGRRGVASEGFC